MYLKAGMRAQTSLCLPVIILLSICQLLAGCARPETAETTPPAQEKEQAAFPQLPAQATYTYQLLPQPDSTFGFEIAQNGKPFIRQTARPAMAGTRGFSKPEQAAKAAELMIDKLRAHKMPPSLSAEEVEAIEQP